MIFKTIATLAVIGTLGIASQLSGCQSSSVNVNDVVTDVKTACAFEPTVATVESELNANPTITSATAIAQAICQAIASVTPTAQSAAPSTTDKVWTTVKVNGKEVAVAGHFVAK